MLSNLRFARGAHVDSSAEMERTDVREDASNTHIYGRTLASSVLYSQRDRGREGRGRERERNNEGGGENESARTNGGALQILSSVNSHDPHSFRSLISSRVGR